MHSNLTTRHVGMVSSELSVGGFTIFFYCVSVKYYVLMLNVMYVRLNV